MKTTKKTINYAPAMISFKSQVQSTLRRKLEVLKKDSSSSRISDSIKLVKKQHKEEVKQMQENVADHEGTIQKMRRERKDWEQVKIRSEQDLKILLEDYASKVEQNKQSQATILHICEQQAILRDENTALRELYETLEEKYHTTFNKKRTEYVSMKNRVRCVEQANDRLRDEVSTTCKKYENLLLFGNNNNGSQQDLLVENQELSSRLDDLETCFDEAWAGFRLEVLNYERKLEQKEKIIRQLNGETQGHIAANTKSFDQT